MRKRKDGQPHKGWKDAVRNTLVREISITYPPELLPSPEPGDEVEVWVQNDDGSFRRMV